ncbi:MAG: hypothetical protein COZ34_04235 [Candidatus Pacebacteria bacterium CG_4_10_14_3_um_filter_34_15]|nr:MAG: hypothetical protein AUJ41_02950 [Candidatus Pacebacteria bacterium CG1_02_43_31]PIQ80626.1 MAG: hypothetical protein COV78_04430 [Candidatus Pacebacteria bacterium CG11_big_fil_rev_8_21_14_0_20_34_55]PIX81251.1 MAG: hypothetical protein COZ34_04235 [Candidatus Pacebacteria bacterium CG_4_10_14_3_um_filter_34_15]PJC43978.1 MAG: hypothetical protein CO039_01075 [Candidatus Pacebacteria bacterium CG_4_9_14_0_2_um_filter_34_50]
MRQETLKAGILRVDSRIQIPVADVVDKTNGMQIFIPSDNDLESGVLDVLKRFAVAKKIGGKHMFWEHQCPPLPHHLDAEKHKILWIDQLGDGATIDFWHDDSWNTLLADREFMSNADVMFAKMQNQAKTENRNLRVYYLFGFAKQSDVARISEKIDKKKVFHRSLQSQYRGHIHVVEAIEDSRDEVRWLNKDDLLDKRSLLPMFLNTAGELAIQHYSGNLRSFGKKITYIQAVSNPKQAENKVIFNIERTMFAFSSWEEALGSVLELYNSLLDSWLLTAAAVADNYIEFAGAQLKFLQGCLPGFTFIRPSVQDKIAGGVDPGINWLIVPFSTVIPQSIVRPGVLLNRPHPNSHS